MTGKRSRNNRFTLIELLVVVGIIGILAAILLPAIGRARHEGKKLQAQSKARDIQLAVESYLSTYNSLPIDETGADLIDVELSQELLDILDGNNPRQKRFFANNGSVLNPWNGKFFISFDGDRNNEVSADGNTVPGNIAVYTKYNDEVMNSWEK